MTVNDSTRVPFLTSGEEVPEEHRHHYESIKESRGGVRGPFKVLMNSPEIAGRVGDLGTQIRYENTLNGTVRELAILVSAREFDNEYCWAPHEPIARDEGASDEAIRAVAHDGPVDSLDEGEALVIQYGRELLRNNSISDETFNAAKARFGNQGIVELSATIGYYALLACVNNSAEVPPPDDYPHLPL